jgi:hypothetical protein
MFGFFLHSITGCAWMWVIQFISKALCYSVFLFCFYIQDINYGAKITESKVEAHLQHDLYCMKNEVGGIVAFLECLAISYILKD